LNANSNFNETESNKNIKKGALVSYLSIFINVLAGLLYTPWMIKQIGQEDFGLYTLAISLISIFLFDFGLGQAISRFLSKYLAEKKYNKINKMLGITYKVYLLIDVLILVTLIVVFINIEYIFNEFTPDEITKFKVVYIIAAVFSVISFPFLTLNGILTAYEKFFQLKLYDLLNRIFSISLIIIALLNDMGLYSLVTANAVSGIITIILKYVTIKRTTSVEVEFKYINKYMMREIFSFSSWSAVVGIAQRLIFNITPSIIGMVSGAKNIAIFGISSSLEGYIYTLANALNSLFLPKVSRIITREDSSQKILSLMIKVGRIQLYVISIVIIGFILLGKDFIYLWVGEEFSLSYWSTILMILPAMFYLPQEIGITAIIALNKVKLQAMVFILMAITNVCLAFIFSWKWGVVGASLSIFISYTIRNIGLNLIYHRVLKLDMIEFFKQTYCKIFPLLLFILIFNYFVFMLMPKVSWVLLLLKGTMLLISYTIIVWVISFNEFEKKLVKSSFNKVINLIKRN